MPILYQDESVVVINKPPGILVHRSEATSRLEPAVLQIMRDRLGCRLYPVHRLDRPTSGVLILALHADAAAHLSQQFAAHLCTKKYLAVVRGWAPESITIAHALRDLDDESAPVQAAETRLQRLATLELECSVDRYPRTRYSLLSMQPSTGRRHQLRRHCKSIFHPIIGDSIYGHGIHNRFFRENYGISRLLLHHEELKLRHPLSGEWLQFCAPMDQDWQKILAAFSWSIQDK